MKKKIIFVILLVTIIIPVYFSTHTLSIGKSDKISLEIPQAYGDCGVLQFCTHESQPYKGICEYQGNCQWDCTDIAPGCSACDCDGVFRQE